jgi:hypothetical protein
MKAVRIRPTLITSILGMLLLAVALPALAMPLALPPRPTPEPAAQPESTGAPIELRVQFSPAWSRSRIPWQELWAVVQWQDRLGNWHDVEGWRGTLDEVNDGVGTKMWWVARVDFDKGPFHWVVYQAPGSKLLAKSESFNLPHFDGKRVRVEVSLQP